MNLKLTLMKGEKMSFHLSVLGLSVSLFAASGLGFFASPIAAQVRNSVKQPKVATVESLVNGDLMCYVTLVDENGIRYQDVGATFEICENENAFLNKKVFLVYRQVPVNDCQSAEPCGKTRQETLIIQMKVADCGNPHACSWDRAELQVQSLPPVRLHHRDQLHRVRQNC